MERGEKYGLLLGCQHPFCLECIRSWRSNGDMFGAETARTCPMCQTEVSAAAGAGAGAAAAAGAGAGAAGAGAGTATAAHPPRLQSYFVVPCDVFLTDEAAKETEQVRYIAIAIATRSACCEFLTVCIASIVHPLGTLPRRCGTRSAFARSRASTSRSGRCDGLFLAVLAQRPLPLHRTAACTPRPMNTYDTDGASTSRSVWACARSALVAASTATSRRMALHGKKTSGVWWVASIDCHTI